MDNGMCWIRCDNLNLSYKHMFNRHEYHYIKVGISLYFFVILGHFTPILYNDNRFCHLKSPQICICCECVICFCFVYLISKIILFLKYKSSCFYFLFNFFSLNIFNIFTFRTFSITTWLLTALDPLLWNHLLNLSIYRLNLSPFIFYLNCFWV